MTIAATSLSVTSGPRWNASQAFKAQGESIQFASLTELNDAIAATPIWHTGQRLRVIAEPHGVEREWSGVHALKAWLAPGVAVTMAAGTNQVRATVGAPTSGGITGDRWVDYAAGMHYTQTGASTWSAPAAIGRAVAASVIDGAGKLTALSAAVGSAMVYLSAAVVDASQFGFVATDIGTGSIDAAVAAAPDGSAAMRALEAYFTAWQGYAVRPLAVQFGHGVYRADRLLLALNTNPNYGRSGLILRGAGIGTTFLAAGVSTANAFVSLSGGGNWAGDFAIEDMTLYGHDSNTRQYGVFLCPNYDAALGFGGLSDINLRNVCVRNFSLGQIWLKGGDEDTLIPVQFLDWKNVIVVQRGTETPCKITGQLGPARFDRVQAYAGNNIYGGVGGQGTAIHIGLDQRTGLVIASVNSGTGVMTLSEPHYMRTGSRVSISGGTTWGGLTVDTAYFAIVTGERALKFASSLANAYAGTALTLTSATGTATLSSPQVSGVSYSPGSLSIIHPTTNGFDRAIYADTCVDLNIELPYAETCHFYLKAVNGTHVTLKGGYFGNVGSNPGGTGILLEADASSTIKREGTQSVQGTVDKLAKGAGVTGGGGARWGGTVYPTIGAGISGMLDAPRQLANTAEIDLGQAPTGDARLNSGQTVVQHIRAQAEPGDTISLRVHAATGAWVEFGIAGNLNLVGRAIAGNTLRFPVDASVRFVVEAVGDTWRLDGYEMPAVRASFDFGTADIAAHGKSPVCTMTIPGARVGDLPPDVGLSDAYDGDLTLKHKITGDNTVDVWLANSTAAAIAGPGNRAITVLQKR